MPIVTREQIETYQKDGVIVLRQLFDQAMLDTVATGMTHCWQDPSSRGRAYEDENDPTAQFSYDARTVGEIEAYDRLMLASPMGEAAGRLMGSEKAIAFYISVFERSAGHQMRSPWHQDQPSWSAEGNQALSIWMSLDDVPKDTALEFVRGSHLWQTNYVRPTFFHSKYDDGDQRDYEVFPDIEANRADHDIVSWALEPGDCVVFHGMIAHGGSGNLPAGLGRRAVSVQWLGDDTRHRLPPGGDDPAISLEVAKHGTKLGDTMVSELCPVAWQRA